MLEIYGDACKLARNYNHFCITSNGDVNRFGECVMGRGIALTVKKYYPNAPKALGTLIKQHGNIVQHFYTTSKGTSLVAFPVKFHWGDYADINLIKQSCKELMRFLGPNETALLPRPGCGNGKLQWSDVKPIISALLDDRVTVVHWVQDK